MTYIDPNSVVSPKASWRLFRVLRNGKANGEGDDDASLAIGMWDDLNGDAPYPVFAMRWNGTKKEATGVGNPQSRGLPTWFIVPWWMNEAIINSGSITSADMPFVTALFS